MASYKWMDEARKMLGTLEGAGKKNNPAIVKLYAECGQRGIIDDSVAWCAAFVGAMLHRAGLPGTGTLWALDYSKWGIKLDGPAVGAVATKKRYDTAGKLVGGHVFFVAGHDKNYIYALGGNQGDSVSIARYKRSVVVAYRWPIGAGVAPRSGLAADGVTSAGLAVGEA